MSMKQVAFLKIAVMPTKGQIQNYIQKLGYDLQIEGELEKQIDQDGLTCRINGHQTYFETFVNDANDTISENEADWILPDITNQDTAISFVWGADFAAGASIGLVSIALIDLSKALVYYIDDQMKYTKEMLLEDTPTFLAELSKVDNLKVDHQEIIKSDRVESERKNTFWESLKNIFK